MDHKLTIPYFTVFTPVYNGEKHIHRVFESISEQIFKDFEWIIVNDGSTDNTAVLIRAFIDQHPEIEIIYLEQENSGKHISWNRAVKLARGILFVPADADDYFFPETLSFFFEKWSQLSPEEQLTISGINVLCLDNDTGNIVGTPYPFDKMKSTNIELELGYKVKGEKWGCIRTDILKSRPFPIIKGSHYPESYLWYYFSKKYKVICFNKPLRKYYTTDTGIMQSELRKVNNPVQNRVNIKYYLWLNANFGFYILRHSPKEFYANIKIIIKSWMHLIIR
jgi:glycosyltransferase involved in cell wall biosynthesis